METRNPVKDKSYTFAIAVTRSVKALQQSEREYVLSKQLLCSGTSIGANIEEAGAARSKRDFITKMAIASKEARESSNWIRLLRDSESVKKNDANRLLQECEELIRLLKAIVKSAQTNPN